jgi:cytochrome oxidase Cu insertion factor (SCO1/SenC/PrrC family)
MQGADGRKMRLSELRGKWLLVYSDTAACPARCQQTLWYMRQVRLAQGVHASRIERVWLVLDSLPPAPALVEDYKGTLVLHATNRRLLEEIPEANQIYLVDPLGNLMMRFPQDPDPRRIIKDLARLLKASRVG